jgi:hypothetical protein
MSKIFVRERRDVGKGAGRPRFAVVAIQGADLKVFAPHIRKSELEALAAAVEAEIVYLPRGEKVEREEEQGQGGGRRKRWQGRQD